MPEPKVTLSPAGNEHLEFLYRVYASTRTEELSIVDWSDAEKEAFLRSQFDAQDRYYHAQFGDAAYDLILADGEPVGRLYVDRRRDDIRIIDLALLPGARSGGIGSRLLNDLLAEARSTGKSVSIHVEQNNPARRLYDRLGFVMIEDRGIYHLMKWTPRS
jgi:ribosomal protein S18 acetylase RimI-like enzyme